MKAQINNIQRFCLHDGPGVRTVVFLQGCPLRCRWCANPETMAKTASLLYTETVCIGCRTCVGACARGNIAWRGDKLTIDRGSCLLCGKCAAACPAGAMRLQGAPMTVERLLPLLLRDRKYYEQSGGGVTLSGGEPCMQPEFCIELLTQLRSRHIHTAVETSGYCEEDVFARIAGACDLLLFDIKHMDTQKHKAGCGVDNTGILQNLVNSAGVCGICIRIPLIHGFNDDQDNLIKTARLAQRLKVKRIDVLPFHRLGASKYFAMDKSYDYLETPAMGAQYAQERAMILREHTSVSVCVI